MKSHDDFFALVALTCILVLMICSCAAAANDEPAPQAASENAAVPRREFRSRPVMKSGPGSITGYSGNAPRRNRFEK